MKCHSVMSSSPDRPLPLSATASTRSSGPVSSSATRGWRSRAQTVAGPGSAKWPLTGRHSTADRYPSIQPSGAPPAVWSGSAGAGPAGGSTVSLVVRSTRQALARATSRPPAVATASRNSTLRPGRTSRACTSTSPTGIAPRISQVNRLTIMSSRGA